MPLLAALDLGTNSFHLVIARVSGNSGIEVVTRHKEMVRLGHGGGDMKVLEPAAIERGLAALRRMRRLADSAGAPLRAIATSAVREAQNAQEFIDRARDEAGVEVDVISGVEEARLIHLGILQAVPVFEKRMIMCDIGGGSTEILVGERGDVLTARSFKLGAVRLTDRFFPGGKVDDASVEACRAYVRSVLTIFEHEVERVGFEVAVGSSGTIEQVAKVANALNGGDALRTYNCFEFTAADLARVVEHLTAARTTAERKHVAGLEPERADIIAAGALVLEGVFQVFGIDRHDDQRERTPGRRAARHPRPFRQRRPAPPRRRVTAQCAPSRRDLRQRPGACRAHGRTRSPALRRHRTLAPLGSHGS
jgi:exopolyphosphatase/guanosine-5'-triphosphate,3'-diphosphate pyrophosphatase